MIRADRSSVQDDSSRGLGSEYATATGGLRKPRTNTVFVYPTRLAERVT
jgi:hypothetical protein